MCQINVYIKTSEGFIDEMFKSLVFLKREEKKKVNFAPIKVLKDLKGSWMKCIK